MKVGIEVMELKTSGGHLYFLPCRISTMHACYLQDARTLKHLYP